MEYRANKQRQSRPYKHEAGGEQDAVIREVHEECIARSMAVCSVNDAAYIATLDLSHKALHL